MSATRTLHGAPAVVCLRALLSARTWRHAPEECGSRYGGWNCLSFSLLRVHFFTSAVSVTAVFMNISTFVFVALALMLQQRAPIEGPQDLWPILLNTISRNVKQTEDL